MSNMTAVMPVVVRARMFAPGLTAWHNEVVDGSIELKRDDNDDYKTRGKMMQQTIPNISLMLIEKFVTMSSRGFCIKARRSEWIRESRGTDL